MVNWLKVSPTRRLAGGERFLTVIGHRDPWYFIDSRVNTPGEVWDTIGNSQYFYVISPNREAAAADKDKVATFGVRVRADIASRAPVSVATAFDDLQRKLGGTMRIESVESVDFKAAQDVETRAEAEQKAVEQGAGQSQARRAVSSVADKATDAFQGAFKTVKVVAVVGAVLLGLLIVNATGILKEGKAFAKEVL